jgi:hypothetical protein
MSRKDTKSFLFLVFCIFVFYSPILLQGRLPGPFEYLNIWRPWHNPSQESYGNYILSDEADHFMPNFSYLKLQLKNINIPFWNPDIDFGSPFFNLLFIGHFYPPVAVSLIFPILFQWFISTGLRFLLTGFFVYKLLDKYKVENSISILSGIVSMFCLYSIVWTGSTSSYPYSATPFFFYAITVFSEESTRKTRSLLALSFINLILSGYPSIIFYIVFVGAFYCLFLFRQKIVKAQGLQLFAFGLLAVMACIIPLFYAAQFLLNVDLEWRTAKGLYALPIRQIAQMAFPLAFGSYSEFAQRQLVNFNESTNYFSIVFLFFSGINYLYLLFRQNYRANSVIVFWSVVQVWSILMVYGLFDILTLFAKLPVFDTNPSTRLNIMIVFSSIIVGAFALQKTIFEPTPRIVLERTVLIVGSIFAVFVFSGIINVYLLRYNMELSVVHVATQLFILIVSLMLIVNASIETSLFLKNVFVAVISIIVFINLYMVGGDYDSSYSRESFYPKTEIVQHLTANLDKGARVITIGRNLIPHMGLFYGIGSVQSHWWSTMSQVELLREFDSDYKKLAPTQDFFDNIDLNQAGELLDFLDIEFIVVNNEDLETMVIDESEYRVLPFPYGVNLIENLNRPYTFEAPVEKCSNKMIYNFHYERNSVWFSTNYCSAKMLVLPIWNYPGWQITQVSNSSITMFDRDGLIALSMPSGHQEVVLKYVPTHFTLFIGITLFSIASILILVFWKKFDVPMLYNSKL